MSNFAEATSPRDLDELEGTLLPVAQAVPLGDAGAPLLVQPATASATSDVPVTSATPASYFSYDSLPNDNDDDARVVDAPVIPIAGSTVPPSTAIEEAEQRAQLARGERYGRIDNDQQAQDIQKVNRQVHSMDYFNKKKLQEANRRAARLSQLEKSGPAPTNELDHVRPSSSLREKSAVGSSTTTSAPQSTLGRDYETSEYDVKEYSTSDYQISEYKSVYES